LISAAIKNSRKKDNDNVKQRFFIVSQMIQMINQKDSILPKKFQNNLLNYLLFNIILNKM